MSKDSRLLNSCAALLLSVAFIVSTGLPLEAQTQKLYLPVLEAPGTQLGLALVNPTFTSVQVTLTARSYEGVIIQNDAIVNPVTLDLPPSSQKALQAVDIFGAGISGQPGWVELTASTSAVKGFFLIYDSGVSFIDGTELTRVPSSRLIFPKVYTTGSSPTQVTVVNTSTETTKAIVSLYENGGRLAGTGAIALFPLSAVTGAVSDWIPSAVGFEGYAVVETEAGSAVQSLIGFETYRNLSDIALVRGFPETAGLRTGYLSHLASRGGYSSVLTLVNFSDQSQVLRIAAGGLQMNGVENVPSSVIVERTLLPYGRLEESVEQMFGLGGDALITGYIHFETVTDTAGVIGVMDFATTDGTLLSAVEGLGEGYSDFSFLHVAEGIGFYTGMVLLNTNNEPVIVTLDSFDRNGTRADSTIVNLNPGERQARLLSDFFKRDVQQLGGYIRATATRPVFTFQVFGSRDGSTFLASVPADGVSLRPQVSGRTVSTLKGANVISDDGSISLLIPPKALSSDTSINVAPISITGLPSPGGDEQPVTAVEALPAGTRFQIPVRLTFPVNVGLDPGTQIPLLIFNPNTGQYETTEFVAIVDNSGRTASAEVTHFTQYVASVSGSKLLNVSSISPSTVSPGDTVTITGAGFSTNINRNTVTFAGTANTSIRATVLSASPTSLQVRVPTGAVTGPVIVRMCCPNKTSQGIVITVITPNPPPGTISISPSTISISSSGLSVAISAASPTVNVEIAGTSFLTGSVVNFDGKPVTTKFIDKTSLVITLTSDELTSGRHGVCVTNPSPGGGTSNVAELTVIADTGNKVPAVNAGPDQTITLPASVILSGTATDDGLPTGSTLTTTWSTLSGPGTVTFGNASALTTTASFLAAGSYVLRLTVSDGTLSSSDDVTITVNSAPGVLSIVSPLTLDRTTVGFGETLRATVTFQNTGGSVVTVNRIVIAGRPPGATNAGGPSADLSPKLGATTIQAGSMMQLSASRAFTSSDPTGTWYAYATYQDASQVWYDGPAVNFTVSALPSSGTNQPPAVNAGPDQTITLPALANLSGTATDDGLPSGSTLTRTWSKVSGAGTVTFGNINAASTRAAFSAAGSYVLRLTASDSALSTSDDVAISVNTASGVLSIVTPLTLDKTTVNIGETLNATVTYKNFGASAITVSRVIIAARPPGATNAGGPSADLSPELGVTTVEPGATVQLSALRAFTSSDPTGNWYAYATYKNASGVWVDGRNVNFTVSTSSPTSGTNQPPAVNAGPDQTITLPASANLSGTATDDGLPSGSTLTRNWTKVSGPGTVTFSNASALTTTATFSTAGAYVLRLTASDSVLSASDDVAVTVNSTPGVISIVTPLTLDKTTVNMGGTLIATVTYKNVGGSAVTVNRVIIAGRPPGATNAGGPTADLSPELGVTTIEPGATVQLSASRAFTSSDPTGNWYAYATYKNASGVWVDGPNVNFTVSTSSPTSGTNQPPAVNAGPDQTITLPASANLGGTATDDGLPSGSTLTRTWSKVSGAGTVTFGNINAASTTAAFSAAGTYVLRLTANDGALSASDDMTINAVNPSSSGSTDATTPGTLILSATFEALSLRATYSNDVNGNNSASVQFRRQGDTTWKDAYTPIVDRRTSISGQTNPYVRQVRGSIVGLTAGTTYEVALSFNDPDGVSGSPTLVGTVTTIAVAPPLSGNPIFVDDVASNGNGSSASPFNSITSALSAATAGDTIFIRAGTYPPFTVSKSGTVSGYIALVGESRDQVFINGGSGDSIDVNGNYIQLKNLRLRRPGKNGISVSGVNHVWIENIYLEDLLTDNYYDAGVWIGNASDIYVLNSYILSPSLTARPAATPRWDSKGEGVFVSSGVRNLVIKGNVIDGGFLDCIGGSPENWGGGPMDNSDIAYNTITNCKDDAIQIEGDDVNLRVYGNDVTANDGYSAVAMAPHLAGPVYVFRNVFRVTAGFGGYAFKLESSPGFAFYIHNTIDTLQNNDGWESPGPNQFLYNNIIKTAGSPLYLPSSAGRYNGNLYYRPSGGYIVSAWNGSNYTSITEFRNATGQEQQGRQGDPLFIDATKHISSSSPAFDAGIVIPNFNDAASAWPYKGAAPEIGVYEVP